MFEFINGDTLNELDNIDINCIDSIITDSLCNIELCSNVDVWKKCLKVLKPGGHLLVFGGSKTFHRIACAIEDASFEIRDTIMWIYGSSLYKTDEAIKPFFEPIIVARKPIEESIISNIIKYNVGGINIDECRVPAKQGEYDIRHYTKEDCFQNLKPKESKFQVKPQPSGRFPANVILTYNESDRDEVCSGFPEGGRNGSITRQYDINNKVYEDYGKCNTWEAYNDSGSAARYFYCARTSYRDTENVDIKPTNLIQYLIRLITPKEGTILDPFMGKGSVSRAVAYENNDNNANYKFIGIEQDKEKCNIAKEKTKYAISDKNKLEINRLDVINNREDELHSLFDYLKEV